MYCFRLEIIEVQPAELFAQWQQEGTSFSIEAKLAKTNAGCRFVEFPSCFEIRSTVNADTLYVCLRRTVTRADGPSPTQELYAEQREDFAISGEHNPFGAVWIIMHEIGNEANIMRANLMWEVSAITNTGNSVLMPRVTGVDLTASGTMSVAVPLQASATMATPLSCTNRDMTPPPSIAYDVSVAELKTTVTEVTTLTQRGGFDNVPMPNEDRENPLATEFSVDMKQPSAPMEVTTPFLPPPANTSAYLLAETRGTSNSDSVTVDAVKTNSHSLAPVQSLELDPQAVAAQTLRPAPRTETGTPLRNVPLSSVLGATVCTSATTRYDSTTTNCPLSASGVTTAPSAAPAAAGKPILDYYGASTQVPLPPGCAFTNLYAVLAPPLVVQEPDTALSAEAQQAQQQRQQQLLQSRIGDVGLSERRASCGSPMRRWSASSTGVSALQSLKEERENAGGAPGGWGAPSQASLNDANKSRNVYMSPADHNKRSGMGVAVPSTRAAAHEDYLSAMHLLRERAMQRVERTKVVYT